MKRPTEEWSSSEDIWATSIVVHSSLFKTHVANAKVRRQLAVQHFRTCGSLLVIDFAKTLPRVPVFQSPLITETSGAHTCQTSVTSKCNEGWSAL